LGPAQIAAVLSKENPLKINHLNEKDSLVTAMACRQPSIDAAVEFWGRAVPALHE
jgi:hypothetical protein